MAEPSRIRAFRRKLMKKQDELSVGGQVVIVVDDDLAVRASLERHLHQVVGIVNVARELDVVAQLRDRQVSVPAILITGRPTAALSQRAARAGVSIVEKPFLGNVLVDRIRDMFSADKGARVN
jgi:FixJ family two-component response regulator